MAPTSAAPHPVRRWPSVLVAIVVTAAITGTLGAVLASRSAVDAPPAVSRVAAKRYVCPMHPAVVQEQPGSCPICGMTLVEQSAASPEPEGEGEPDVEGHAAISIEPSRQRLIGLRTSLVDRGPIGSALRTVGKVAVDETRVRRVSVKVSGYVERVFLDFVGKPVRQGQPLFSLYSPEVLATQAELLLALDGHPELAKAARRKLELWDVPQAEVQRLERERVAARAVTFVSPASGVVTKKDVVQGARLEAGATPYEVVDLSEVWVLAEVYETELRFVEPGMAASLRLTAYPGRAYSGTVRFIDPVLDAQTRTVKVRLAFANPSGELKPELFGEVTLERPARDVLRVPTDALIHTGAVELAFVARDGRRFEPRVVETGESGRDFTEVLAGLAEGEAVVTRANFLVDSESSLRASLSRLGHDAQPSSRPTSPHAGHEGP